MLRQTGRPIPGIDSGITELPEMFHQGRKMGPVRSTTDGQFALPHPLTFSGLMNSAWRIYSSRWDEAYNSARENALAMRDDCWLMAMLRERQMAVEQLSWHIEPEDEKDPYQKQVADRVQKIIQAIPGLHRIKRNLLECIWFGRAGVQVTWVKKMVDGLLATTIGRYRAVNGDKIQFRYRLKNDAPWIEDGTPVVLVNSAYLHQMAAGTRIVSTDRAQGVLLTPGYWRDRFLISMHEMDDDDFFELQGAGRIFGIGIRDRIFWLDWLRKEFLSWITDFIERIGLGLTIYYYEQSNAESKKKAEEAALAQTKNAVLTWPRPIGQEKQGAGVERIEVPLSGSDMLLKLMDLIADMIERYMVGQTGSSRSDTSGMGTHSTDFMQDTKYRITKSDALNADEYLTSELVNRIKDYNYPNNSAPFELRHKLDVDRPNVKDILDSAKTIFDMGIPLKTDEVRGAPGFSRPEGDDEVTQRQDLMETMLGGSLGGLPTGGGQNPAQAPTDNGGQPVQRPASACGPGQRPSGTGCTPGGQYGENGWTDDMENIGWPIRPTATGDGGQNEWNRPDVVQSWDNAYVGYSRREAEGMMKFAEDCTQGRTAAQTDCTPGAGEGRQLLTPQEEAYKTFVNIQNNLADLDIAEIRAKFEPLKKLTRKALDDVTVMLGRKFRGTKEEIVSQLLSILETTKVSQVQTGLIGAGSKGHRELTAEEKKRVGLIGFSRTAAEKLIYQAELENICKRVRQGHRGNGGLDALAGLLGITKNGQRGMAEPASAILQHFQKVGSQPGELPGLSLDAPAWPAKHQQPSATIEPTLKDEFHQGRGDTIRDQEYRAKLRESFESRQAEIGNLDASAPGNPYLARVLNVLMANPAATFGLGGLEKYRELVNMAQQGGYLTPEQETMLKQSREMVQRKVLNGEVSYDAIEDALRGVSTSGYGTLSPAEYWEMANEAFKTRNVAPFQF